MTSAEMLPAVVVTPRKPRSARIEAIPGPVAGPGEALVRVLQVGLCGTDAEIVAGLYGDAPPGEDRLILGHESFGIVEHVPSGAAGLSVGDYVVGIVRHPDGCPNCQRAEWDMCLWGDYTERGIRAIHGFMRPLYTEGPEFLVPAPAPLLAVGVLLEPLTIVEKAWSEIALMQGRLHWEPRTAVVLGAGPVGLLGAALLRLQGLEVTVVATTPAPNPRAAIAEALGAGYVSARAVPVANLPEHLGKRIDVVVEATGNSSVAMDALGIAGANGIVCLTSVTGGNRIVEVPADVLNQRLVLNNVAIFGTVNANRGHYEAAVRDLSAFRVRWPGVIERIISHRFPLREFPAALAAHEGRDGIKVVLDVSDELGQ